MMLPRLEARDSLLEAERVTIGVGRLKQSDHKAVVRRWQRQAGADAATKASTPGGFIAALAAAGVPVKRVRRQAVTSPSRRRRKAP